MNLLVDNRANEELTLTKEGQIDLPDGVPPLTSLYLYIAGSCNLACRHCWIAPNYVPNGKGGKFIPLEYVNKAIQEALPLGLQSVKLTGGEPTLHPRFREIVEVIDRARLNIQMETNGLLIDNDLAQFIKSKPNFSHISVSLDGADAATHESLRMVTGSFEQAIRGIKNLVKSGIYPQIICTLFRGNQNQIYDIIKLTENLRCGSIKFNHIQRIGRGENLIRQEGLTIPDLISTYHFITKELAPYFRIPIYFNIPFAFYPIGNLLNGNLGCCHILNILGMLSTGDLSICGIGETKPELIYGNILDNSLSDIWSNALGLHELRELIPAKLEGICGDCLHRDFCLGECVANNYYETGKINSSYHFCTQADKAGLFPETRRKKS